MKIFSDRRVARVTSACLCAAVALGGPFAVLCAPRPAAAATEAQVGDAVRKAVDWLYSKQMPDGTWEQVPAPVAKWNNATSLQNAQWGWLTAVSTLSLLAAGESPHDPRLAKAVEFLSKAEFRGIFAIGTRAQCWPYLPDNPDRRPLVRRDGQALLAAVTAIGPNAGLYDYTVPAPRKPGEKRRPAPPVLTTNSKNFRAANHAPSLYGVLGMAACARCGFEVPQSYWAMVDQAWRKNQMDDGGWTYVGEDATRENMNMTAGGLAVLFITQNYLSLGRSVGCRGVLPDKGLALAMDWCDKHYDEVLKPFQFDRLRIDNDALYVLGKVAATGGRKYLGDRDWFADGADMVLKRRDKDGSWQSVPDTALALLFLVHGRAPVVMSKLQYDVDGREGNWNGRARDAANVTNYVAEQLERDLAWQSVTLKAATTEDLHDAPILYVSGNQKIDFSDEDKAKLRLFVQQGGMILGNADCGDANFADGFKALGRALFPDYEFRELPPTSPVYDEQSKPDEWKNPPSVLAMSNGARELMMLFPSADASKAWQLNQPNGQYAPLYQVMDDIFLYAVDKQDLRFRGDSYLVEPDKKVNVKKTIKVARLQYDGNWDPEPGGWQRLAAVMHNRRLTDLQVTPVRLGEGKLTKAYAVAHLTGTAKFRLSDAAKAELKQYLDDGGHLVVDAAGGSAEFAAAAEGLLTDLYLVSKPTPLEADSPVYKAGERVESVDYRRYAWKSLEGGNRHAPRLRGMDVNGKLAVVESPDDLSVGLVGMPIDGIKGYSPESATTLMMNVLTWADEGKR